MKQKTMGMDYELTDNLCDDIVINNAIMTNMEEISNLRNTIEMHQRLIATLTNRVDILNVLISQGFVTHKSRV